MDRDGLGHVTVEHEGMGKPVVGAAKQEPQPGLVFDPAMTPEDDPLAGETTENGAQPGERVPSHAQQHDRVDIAPQPQRDLPGLEHDRADFPASCLGERDVGWKVPRLDALLDRCPVADQYVVVAASPAELFQHGGAIMREEVISDRDAPGRESDRASRLTASPEPFMMPWPAAASAPASRALWGKGDRNGGSLSDEPRNKRVRNHDLVESADNGRVVRRWTKVAWNHKSASCLRQTWRAVRRLLESSTDPPQPDPLLCAFQNLGAADSVCSKIRGLASARQDPSFARLASRTRAAVQRSGSFQRQSGDTVIKHIARSVLRQVGWELRRFDPQSSEWARLVRALGSHGVNVVLDVGANTGQFAKALRASGFADRIISFEPLKDPHAELSALARHDRLWEIAPRV